MYIKAEDSAKYFKYLSSDIRLGADVGMSDLKHATNVILNSLEIIEGPDAGAQWTDQCSMVADSIVETCDAGNATLETHSTAVSSLAVILGLGLGIADKQSLIDLSVGGMIHDIGLSKSRPEFVEKK